MTAATGSAAATADQLTNIPVAVDLCRPLATVLNATALTTTRQRVEQELTTLLNELGLPGRPNVTLSPSRTIRPLDVAVHGRRRRYPLQMLWSSPALLEEAPGDPRLFARTPAAWTSLVEARLAMLRDGATLWAIKFVPWLATTVVRFAPGCLVGPQQAAAYLGAESERAGLGDAYVRTILAGLLDLGVAVHQREVVLATVRAGADLGAPPAEVVEQTFRLLRRHDVAVLAHPAYLDLLVGGKPEAREVLRRQLDYVEEAVQVDLGLPPPRVHIEADPTLPDGWLAVRIHDQRGWATPGLPADSLLVQESARQAADRGLAARPMENPYTGEEVAQVPAAAADTLERAGVPFWTADTYAAIVVHLALRRRVPQLLGPAEVEYRLAGLSETDPDLVLLTLRLFSITTLTAVLRRLAAEGIPIRDLRTILESAVLIHWDDVLTGAPDRAAEVDDIEILTARIRRMLSESISAQVAGKTRTIHALRIDPEYERRAIALRARRHQADGERAVGDDERDADELLDELWTAVHRASLTNTRAVLLTSDVARAAVRELAAAELPELTVLADSELRPDIRLVYLPTRVAEQQ